MWNDYIIDWQGGASAFDERDECRGTRQKADECSCAPADRDPQRKENWRFCPVCGHAL